jgi:hypothetical protein
MKRIFYVLAIYICFLYRSSHAGSRSDSDEIENIRRNMDALRSILYHTSYIEKVEDASKWYELAVLVHSYDTRVHSGTMHIHFETSA